MQDKLVKLCKNSGQSVKIQLTKCNKYVIIYLQKQRYTLESLRELYENVIVFV